MLTSWSEVSTPAELSMKSVLSNTPLRAASMRPFWVRPRLPPSPTILQRRSSPLMRSALLARSPTSALVSDAAFTYVPMPPFHNRSTGALRIALMSSVGDSDSTSAPIPSTSRISGVIATALRLRANTPPPLEIFDLS